MENIKDYRNKELTWYIIANILILFCMLSGFNLNITSEVSSTAEIVNKVLGISVFSGIIYVFVFILDSIFDSTTKKYIVNLKFKLPGQVVFSNLKNKKYKDIRFTLEDVENKYKEYMIICLMKKKKSVIMKIKTGIIYIRSTRMIK